MSMHMRFLGPPPSWKFMALSFRSDVSKYLLYRLVLVLIVCVTSNYILMHLQMQRYV